MSPGRDTRTDGRTGGQTDLQNSHSYTRSQQYLTGEFSPMLSTAWHFIEGN